MRRCLAVLTFLSLVPFHTLAASHQHTEQAASISKLKPFIDYLGEFSTRRRSNIYFRNPQSIFYGAQISFVNVGRGNATFLRRDLVTAGRLPIVVGRIYDSASSGSVDFGPGWLLGNAEEIKLSENTAELRSENGSPVTFNRQSDKYVLRDDRPSDYVELRTVPNGILRLTLRNGDVREFALIDGAFRLVRVTDSASNAVELSYSNGVVATIRNQTHSVQFTRDQHLRILAATDDLGRRTEYLYDGKGVLSGVIDLGGSSWGYSYTGDHQLRAASDPDGKTTFKFQYGPSNRIAAIELPSGKVTFRYDDSAHTTRVVDRKSIESVYHQNAEGITTNVTNGLGETWSAQLDGNRNVVSIGRNGSLQSVFRYSKDHKLIWRSQATASGLVEANYQYDDSGQLVTIDYNDSTAANFMYSAPGRLQRATWRDGATSTYGFDSRGDLVTLVGSSDLLV